MADVAPSPYTLHYQDDPPLIRLRLTGFWTMAVFDSFIRERARTIDRHPNVDILSRATDFPLQSPDVAAAFADVPHPLGIRTAIVIETALGRTQPRRVNEHNSSIGLFASEAEALVWLAKR